MAASLRALNFLIIEKRVGPTTGQFYDWCSWYSCLESAAGDTPTILKALNLCIKKLE